MKTNYTLIKSLAVTLLFAASSWGQTTLVRWNFNGPDAMTIPGGSVSPTPSEGNGSATLVGGTTASFASGNSSTGTTETETTSPPNFGWNTTGYPAAGTGNKTAGVEFRVNTTGYSGIIFTMEQRLSNTAANTYVVQYTTNWTAAIPLWEDAQTFTFTPAATGTGDTWYNFRTVDVSAVTMLDNNPNVAFRVVSAYDPGTGDYLAARSTSTYAGGTVRYDSVMITANTQLGVSQFELENGFVLYPNPSRHEIVNFNKAQDITVFDVMGKMILNQKEATSIDTRAFTSGVYFVKTATGFTKKLVVE
ncbi:MAG TPA: T9SS type A sorting domain-containing protein [Flavobacterium sp.]